ncbi:hypothetical protein [Embleya hyalina]|uniref:Alpha-1 2-mannosidase n=1 Tax=Embleya hyalina TaxID=516124 RepID=A0A401YM14_9ACTN|nr:hypothetical protein [Embleya hyalina]GCD95637.1 alpha-1 2-mannosidase [Embleya hyalina]
MSPIRRRPATALALTALLAAGLTTAAPVVWAAPSEPTAAARTGVPAIDLDRAAAGDFGPCTTTVRGVLSKPLTIASGITCLDGATVRGPVRVEPGAGLIATRSTVTGPVSAHGATALVLADTTVGGPVTGTDAIGVTALLWSRVGGPVHLAGNKGPSQVLANTVGGPLNCAGNTPEPTNAGLPNTVKGPKSGQCASL